MGGETAAQATKVVAVDDSPQVTALWERVFGPVFDLTCFSDPLEALSYFREHDLDVALLDIEMPGMDGITLLKRLRELRPAAEAIIVSGAGTVERAVEAMKLGAYDFLTKPVTDPTVACRRIEAAAERKRLRSLNESLQARLEAFGSSHELIGESDSLRRIRSLIVKVADSRAPVLITGESGTGKELVAKSVHAASNRSRGPFVAVNCAAIAESLVDSELFGHHKGAFTGATAARRGLFDAANGGTLFLDEIGDVPPATQVRLLRALQEGEIRAVGATNNHSVDVRIVAATHADLADAMTTGRFREDLYYRIATFPISLPPLRERRSDIPILAQHLLDLTNRRHGRAPMHFSEEALAALVAFHWPGNVRQLSNVVEYAATLATLEEVQVQDLPSYVTAPGTKEAGASPAPAPSTGSLFERPYGEAKNLAMADFERNYVQRVLEAVGGNVSAAARKAGLDRSNLRRLMRRHELGAE